VSHSEALEITDFREIDGNDAVTSNYSAGGEKINYANKQAPAEYPLTDIREFYDRGETNTYEITIERTSSEDAWLTYRAAFEPLIHNDSEPVEFARYPNDDQIETVDQQNFTAFNLSGQDQKVQDLPPIARISAPSTTVTAGESVTFESSQSSDDRGITARTWRIPDGKGNTETIDGTSATTAFDSSGRYEVSLTVEDTNGATNTATLNVSVAPKPELTAGFEANRTVIQPGDSTRLRATIDADQYAWDLDDDGSVEARSREATLQTPTAGEYTVTLGVQVGNQQDRVSYTYVVEPAEQRVSAPTPVFDGPSTLNVTETGTFDASESTDQRISDDEVVPGEISRYEWDFDGDGEPEKTGKTVDYSFDTVQTTPVQLTVIDSEGNQRSTNRTVEVVSPIAVSVDAGENRVINESATVELNATSTSVPNGTDLEYEWTHIGTSPASVRDGNTSTPEFRAPLVDYNSSVTFRVTVTDRWGGVASDTVRISITDVGVWVDNDRESGTYNSIQAAVDDAEPGDRVNIRPGVYHESIGFSKDISLIAPRGATLQGNNRFGTAIVGRGYTYSPRANSVKIEGLKIENYNHQAIRIDEVSKGTWTIKNVTIQNISGEGIQATSRYDGDGNRVNWTVKDTIIKNTEEESIHAGDSEGDWVIQNSTFESGVQSGVDAPNSGGDWLIERTQFNHSLGGAGVAARRSTGDWTIRDAVIRNTSDADEFESASIGATRSSGDWEIINTSVRDSRGIDASRSSGSFEIKRTSLSSRFGNSNIELYSSVGAWKIQSSDINGAIAASQSQGSWIIQNTDVKRVDARRTDGSWVIQKAAIEDLSASQSTGSWAVRRSVIEKRISTLGSEGSWSIHRSSVLGRASTRLTGQGNATRNWWGSASGPSTFECDEGVNCEDPLESPPPRAGLGKVADSTPDVDTGPDRTVSDDAVVTLSAASSGGDVTKYIWTQATGPTVTIRNASTRTPEFDAPYLSMGRQTLTFHVTAFSNGLADTEAVEIVVEKELVANAGENRTVDENTTVELEGVRSTGDDYLDYNWTQTGGVDVQLRDSRTSTPKFTAPSVEGIERLKFTLEVSDSDETTTDSVTISVENQNAPIAQTGSDRLITGGQTIELDATESSDPNGDSLTYSWTQVEGPNATLEDTQTATPELAAPTVTANRTLTYRVQVSDGTDTDIAYTNVTVTPNAPPTASLQTSRDGSQLRDGARVEEEEGLELRADGSTDPNGDEVTYSWNQVRGPPARIDPSFDGKEARVRLPPVDRNRTVTFELTVSDGRLNDTERINITLTPTPDLSLDLSKAQPEYVLGSEVALSGPAPNAEAAALYVQERESAAYRLVELDGQRTFDINGDSLADSSLPSDGVILPGGRAPGNVLLTRYGVHDLAIVAARDAGSPYRPAPALSANEVAEAEKTTTQIRVVPPRLNTTLQTVGGEVAVEDSEVGINGTASGHNVVTVVLVGENGTVRFEQVAVDDVGRVTDDIALFGPRGQFERGPIEVFVLASGRDGEFGDGEFPDARVLEEFLDTLDADSAAEVRAALRNQTVEDEGPTLPGRGQYPFPTDESDDLLETTQFRFTNASTGVKRVAPEDANRTGITPVPNGSAMIVRGTTNLDPDDNTLTVELRASPNNTVRSIQLNRWSSNGTFSAEVDTTGLPAGSYMLFVDDRYESTTVPVTITDEAQSPQGPTASAGANRTVDANATVELDGDGSSAPTGDTLQYQWRQVSGPSVSLTDANSTTPTFAAPAVGVSTALAFELTVADGDGKADTDRVTVTVSPATTDTLLVSPGTNGDYSTIDAAVENASTGATIEVRPGTYRGTVDVSKSITLVAPNGATLDGGVTPDRTLPVAPNRSAAAIEIGDDASPTIEGFTIRNYDAAAIYAFGTTEDWTLRNTTIHDTTIGVGASGSDGAWRLDGVRIRSVTSPVYADDSTGAFAIRDTVLRSNRLALVTTNATGDWTLRNTTIRNTNGTAVYAANTTGKWSIHGSTIAGNDRGINATGAAPAGNASRNWWGDSSGPGGTFAGTGDTAVGNVTVNPYYADRALTTTATVPMPSPGPANLTVAPPSLPANVTVDTTLSASATITNVGGRNATQAIDFRLDVDRDGTLENTSLERQERTNVTLASGEHRSLQFETYTGGLSPGTYRYGVFTANDSQTGIVNVTRPPSAAATIQFDDATVVNGTRTVTVDRANYTGGQYYVVLHAEQSPGDGAVDLSTPLGNSSELAPGKHTDITVDLDPYAASGDDVDALTRDRPLVAVVHRTDPGANTFAGIVTANGTAVADSATVDVREVSQVTVGPTDATATFTSIDHAIDSVPDDGTVILRPSTYEQQLYVDRNVTLVAPDGATFDGRNIEEIVASAIIIGDDASPTISGVTVRNYDWGVSASNTTGDWTLRNVTVRNNTVGVQATESTGSWRIVDSSIRDHSNEGVYARRTTGDWRIERTQIRDTDDAGVDATRAEGDWIIDGAAISESLGPAIEATRTDGNWLVRTSAIRNNTIGVDATNARGSWTVRTTQVRSNTLEGIVAAATTGDWTVTNATLVANYRGVNATRSTGAWTVTDSRLENNTVAVDARGAVTAGSASKNWWGATDGPSGIFRGDGGAVRGNVLVRPFYTDAQRTTLSAPIRASVTFENTTVRPGTETLTVDRANYTGQPYVVVLYRDASPDDERRNFSTAVGVSSSLSTGEHADVPVDIGTTLSQNDTLDRLTANATLVARIHRTGGPSETYGAAVPRGNATAEVGVELPPATVDAGTATAISNTTVSVPIRARNATNVVTVGANVSYDPTLANVTAVSSSDAEDSTVTVDNENGTLRFEYRYAERETPTVNVTFDAETATGASTPITVANATVETAGPREPSVRTAAGRLTVLGSTVTVTNSTLDVTTVRPDDTVVVTATVTNAAPVAGTFGVPLRVNDSQDRVRNVSLDATATTTVRFTYTPTEPGTTVISVGTGAPRTLTVDAITVDETRTTTTVGGRTAPGTPLNASLAGTNGTSDAGVSLDRVNVSTTREANVSLEVNVSADSSGAPPLGDAAAYLNVSESVPEDAIGTVSFAFTVDTDRLSNPESAELYRYHDGTWNALETTYLGETNGEYRFQTVSPGLSVFAVRQSTSGDGGDDSGGLETDGESASTPAATAAPTSPSTPGQSTATPSTATPASTSEDIDPSETTPSAETRTADSSEAVQNQRPNSTAVEPGGFDAPIFVVVLALLVGSLAAVAILRRRNRL
jgi:PGF-pre-PGF domain-containing protein